MTKYKIKMTKYNERQRIIDYLEWYDLLIVTKYNHELEFINHGPNEYLDQYMVLIGKKQLKKLTDDEVKDILLWCESGERSRVRDMSILLDITVDNDWGLYLSTYEVKTDEVVVSTAEGDITMKANDYTKKRAYDLFIKAAKEASK